MQIADCRFDRQSVCLRAICFLQPICNLQSRICNFTLIASLVLLLPPGGVSAQSAASDAIDDPESYAVYAAVLATRWPKPEIPQATVALEGNTTARPPCTAWGNLLAPEWQQAVERYATENA